MHCDLLQIAMPLANGKVYQHMAFGPNNIIAASHEGTVSAQAGPA